VDGVVRIPAGYRSPKDGEPNIVITRSVSLVAQVPGTAWFTPKDSNKSCITVDLRQRARVLIQGLVVRGHTGKGAPCIYLKAEAPEARSGTAAGPQLFVLSESAVIGSPETNAVEIRGGSARLERNYIGGARIGILVQDRRLGSHAILQNDIDGNASGLVVVGSEVSANGNLLHRSSEHGIWSVNGGGDFRSNLIYGNSTGVRLVYSESPAEVAATGAAYSTGAPSAGPEGAGAAGASQTAAQQAPAQASSYSVGLGTSGVFAGCYGIPCFDKNVISRNTRAGVVALGYQAQTIASFTDNCIYGNATDVVNGRIGKARNRRACDAQGMTLAETARVTLQSAAAWVAQWSEVGLSREPTLGADW
jgi:hypothetical protein